MAAPGQASASIIDKLKVDSIASWGKFPRFCMNVYHWGDEFFNGFDSLYVSRTHTNFDFRVNLDSWADVYNFNLPENKQIFMRTDPASSIGFSLGYLAVSIGYDWNLTQFFGGPTNVRKRFKLGFTCSLLSCEYYDTHYDGDVHITRFGPRNAATSMNLPFKGINMHTRGADLYMFFNPKRYSKSAAFNYGRLQQRSAGSFFAGFSYFHNAYHFDFSELPVDMRDQLPQSWDNYSYNVNTNNYCLRFGYGFNWVLNKHILIGISESPILGLQKGRITGSDKPDSMSLANRFRLSVVWNNHHWFAGIIGNSEQGLIYNKKQAFINSDLSVNACIGYRFNLW